MKITALTSAMALAFFMNNGVQAAGTVGFADFSLGLSHAKDASNTDYQSNGFATLSGGVAIPAGASGTVVLDADLTKDNTGGEVLFGAGMKTPQGQVGAHYFHDIGGNKLGAFMAYADADHDGGNEHYKTFFGGIEGITAVSPVVTLYGQAGYGNALNDNESSGGFDNGWLARAGLAYSGFANTLVKVEGEYARSKDYEDSNEDGRFWKIALMGETELGAVKGLAVTYGISRAVYDATNDPNMVTENQVKVGVRYYFGGTNSLGALKSGLIGLPSIPLRASSWTPALD